MLQKKSCIVLGTFNVNNKRSYKVGDCHKPYEEALQIYGLITMKKRRVVLTSKFALDVARSEKHNGMFIKNI